MKQLTIIKPSTDDVVLTELSKFMQKPQEAYLQAAKHILHYLCRYPDLGCFSNKRRRIVYIDKLTLTTIKMQTTIYQLVLISSFLEDHQSFGIPRTNLIPPDHRVSLSTELWLNAPVKLSGLEDYYKNSDSQTTNQLSSTVTIKVASNSATTPSFTTNKKKIEIIYHFTHQIVENNTIRVEYISTQE